MHLHAYVGRLLKDEPYAKSVQSKFFDHCDNTVNLDALSRCRALNELLETHVSFRAITVWNGLHRNDDFALQLLWESNPTSHTGGVRQLGHLRVHLPSNKVSRKPRSEKCIETIGKQRGDSCGVFFSTTRDVGGGNMTLWQLLTNGVTQVKLRHLPQCRLNKAMGVQARLKEALELLHLRHTNQDTHALGSTPLPSLNLLQVSLGAMLLMVLRSQYQAMARPTQS